ncbi:terminase family protein [Vibrio vulnificus]
MNRIKLEYLELLEEKARRIEYNAKYYKLSSFKPYPFQSDFYRASKYYKRRFLCAANRVGKSYSEAYEMAMHLTGLYPDWWEGHKFDYPILAWAVGITGDSTRKVLQKELFGTPMAKDTDSLGTGAIPRHLIDFEHLEREGHVVKIAKIKHVSGEYSTLEFRSTQQGEHTLMGATVDYIWLDEEDPYRSSQIYSQCVTRTGTTGGQVVITATPENGLTSLVDLFMTNEKGKLYWQNATWEDAPHLDEETKNELLASIPEWQHDMRTKGIPLSSSGVVFPIDHSKIITDPLDIEDWDDILLGLDITHKGQEGNDPTVCTVLCRKQGAANDGTDLYYIHEQKTFPVDGDADGITRWLNTTKYPRIPVIIPADGGQTFGKAMSDYAFHHNLEVNVQAEVFRNPEQVLSSFGLSTKPNPRDINIGLDWMNHMFKEGKLKINRQCKDLLREMTTYERTGKKGDAAFRGRDDHIDSARYGFMSIYGHRGVPAGQCKKTNEDWNNGFHSYDDNVAKELAQFY